MLIKFPADLAQQAFHHINPDYVISVRAEAGRPDGGSYVILPEDQSFWTPMTPSQVQQFINKAECNMETHVRSRLVSGE